jgi:hypothetical protein
LTAQDQIAVTQFELKPPPAYDTAPTVSIVEDEIVVVGPGSIAFSMTWAAAKETHRRLGEVLRSHELSRSSTSK